MGTRGAVANLSGRGERRRASERAGRREKAAEGSRALGWGRGGPRPRAAPGHVTRRVVVRPAWVAGAARGRGRRGAGSRDGV